MTVKTFQLEAQKPYGLVTTLVEGELSYDPLDPLVIGVKLPSNQFSKQPSWILGKDLLMQGVYHKAGSGEVKVWPVFKANPWRVHVKISNAVLLRFVRKELKLFLDDIFLDNANGQEILEQMLERELVTILYGGKD